jgi:hypothetical protein
MQIQLVTQDEANSTAERKGKEEMNGTKTNSGERKHKKKKERYNIAILKF